MQKRKGRAVRAWGKLCTKCKTVKALRYFYTDSRRPDGKQPHCIACRALWRAAYMRTSGYRASVRRRNNSPGHVIRTRRWKLQNKLKHQCHKAVEWALGSGKLVKLPCTKCGESRSAAHHEDYSRPLDVMWLCAKHHVERHKELKSPVRHPAGRQQRKGASK